MITILVTVFFWGLLASGRRQKILSWRGMGYGVFVLFVGILVAPLPSFVFGHWGTNVPLRYYGRLLDKPYQVAVIALFVSIIIVFWYSLARRFGRVSISDRTLGALLVLWVGMIGTSIFIPALSFMLTWPLLFSLLACTNWFYWYGRQKYSNTVLLGLLISGAINIIILGPTIMLGLFDQMALTSLLIGVLCGFLIPQIYLMLGYPILNPETRTL
jgi:hypothetical protein